MSASDQDPSTNPQIVALIGRTDWGPVARSLAERYDLPEVDTAAKSLIVTGSEISLPEGWSTRDVDLVTWGRLGEGLTLPTVSGYKTEVRELPGGQLRTHFSMSYSRWGAVTNQAGDGWFVARAYELASGPCTGVLLVPMVSPIIDKKYPIVADLDGRRLSSTVSVEGPNIFFDFDQDADLSGVKAYIRGNIPEYGMDLEVRHWGKTHTFALAAQPSRPVVLVTQPKMLFPSMIGGILRRNGLLPREAGLLPDVRVVADTALVGGFGMGMINAEIRVKESTFRTKTFSSERIAVSGSEAQ